MKSNHGISWCVRCAWVCPCSAPFEKYSSMIWKMIPIIIHNPNHFSEQLIKGRGVKGNTVTKHPIKKIELKEKGVSTLKPRKIWYDETVKRLNVDERGTLLGEFKAEDRLLIITQSGKIKTIIPELTTHFDEDMIILEKWIKDKPISAVYYDPEKDRHFVKRFVVENENKEEIFISEHPHAKLEVVSTDYRPMAEVVFPKVKGTQKDNMELNFEEFIAIKGIKAQGNQLDSERVRSVKLIESLPYEVEGEEEEEEENPHKDGNTQIEMEF